MELPDCKKMMELCTKHNLFEYSDWRFVVKGYLTADPLEFHLWLTKRVHFVMMHIARNQWHGCK